MDWDFRNQIVAMWDTLGGEDPLIRPAIIGYLLACPSEKSASLLAQLREKNIRAIRKRLDKRRQYPFLLLLLSASSIVRRTIEYPDRSCETSSFYCSCVSAAESGFITAVAAGVTGSCQPVVTISASLCCNRFVSSAVEI